MAQNVPKIDADSSNIELKKLIDQFETFLDATDQARLDSEECRDYKDHKQWTEDEVAELKKRGQAPIVNNRIAPKVKFMIGEQQRRRRKPKAYPRTPEHEETADAITDALRYVCDNNDFKHTSSEVFENEVVEGYGGVIVEPEVNANGEVEIMQTYIPWDRYYFDPHSRRKDFEDKKYDGIVLWLDESDVKALVSDEKKVDIDVLFSTASDRTEEETFADRPLWIDRRRRRLKVCQHYFLHEDVWHVAYFTDGMFLIDPKPSPSLDENDEPENPIVTQTAFMDRDNNRYSEVKAYIHIQDEINHRHSKYLHTMSVRQTWSTQGAVKDVQKIKNELSKPNGHAEFEHGKFGDDFGVLPTFDMAQGQFNLLQEAKANIDAISVNAELEGRGPASQSGRAIIAKQQGGLTELGPLYDQHKSWELRVYRKTYNAIHQYWDKEKWIRVTDDESDLKWVGLNQPMTYGDLLQEKLEDNETPPEMKEQAAMLLDSGDPRLEQQAEVKNYVPEIDVDIIIEDGADSITVQQEQFETMAALAQTYGPQEVPFRVMLELSQLPQKDQVMDLLTGEDGADPALLQLQQQMDQMAAEAQETIGALSQELEGLKTDKSLEAAKLDIENKKVEVDAGAKQASATIDQQELILKGKELELKGQELQLKANEMSNGSDERIKLTEISTKAQTEIEVANINANAQVCTAQATHPPMEKTEPQSIYVNVGSGQKKIELQRDSEGVATGATVEEV